MQYSQLRIVMTNAACNLNCAYCRSGYEIPHVHQTNSQVDTEKMKNAIKGHKFKSITIWGGEPLFNWEKFKNVVEFCKEHIENSVKLGIVTNGTLLTADKVQFINKNNIDLTISHDGYNQHYRSKDFLQDEEYIKLLRQINTNIGFHTVLHRYNVDLIKTMEYFKYIEEKLEKKIGWSWELFEVTNPLSFEFLPRGIEYFKLIKSLDKLYEEMKKGNRMAGGALYNILISTANRYKNQEKAGFRCGADKRLTIDTEGKTYFCQVQAELKLNTQPEFKIPDSCKDCPVKYICTGICPIMPEAYRKKACFYYFMFYYKILMLLSKSGGEL